MGSATLSGYPVSTAAVTRPRWGIWSAEVYLVDPAELAGSVSLTIEDLVLAGTVVRGGPVEGSARYLITGGAGGWRRVIGPQGYRNDLGIKLSTVLADAARAAGERVELDPALERVLGPAWVRRAGQAWNTFGRLSLPWWVDDAGTTQVRVRPAPVVAAPSRLISRDRGRALREVAADSLAAWAPGAVFDGSPIEHVTIHCEHGRARMQVLG
jgi:hypothetical protein